MSKKATSGAKLLPLHLPPYEISVLPNGLTVHVVRKTTVPLVALRLFIRAGSAFDMPQQRGVADFAARLLRRGAAGRLADEINEEVESLGASFAAYANEENVVLALSAPAKQLGVMLEVLAQFVCAPDFPEEEIQLAKRRTLAHMASELDEPDILANRALARAVWGQHPYAFEASGNKADVARLTKSQLQNFHATRMGPKVSQLFIVGDVEVSQVMRHIQRTLGSWTLGPQCAPQIPQFEGIPEPRKVLIVDKPEHTQVQMRIGAVGVRRGHPEHFPIVVMNAVLGGSFTSRLMTAIRVKRGLSYGASSSFDMLSAAGALCIASFTRTESVEELIQTALNEVERMRLKGPTKQEVATVQRYMCGLYPSRLETNEAIAGTLADVVHYGLPVEWVVRFRERICAVTLKQAALAARQHLFRSDRVLVVVGNAQILRTQMEQYGNSIVLRPEELE